jgi:hypothetical protein
MAKKAVNIVVKVVVFVAIVALIAAWIAVKTAKNERLLQQLLAGDEDARHEVARKLAYIEIMTLF